MKRSPLMEMILAGCIALILTAEVPPPEKSAPAKVDQVTTGSSRTESAGMTTEQKTSRAHEHMTRIGKALEAYHAGQKQYPAPAKAPTRRARVTSATTPAGTPAATKEPRETTATLKIMPPTVLNSLTTPIAYLSNIPPDIFTPPQAQAPYMYWAPPQKEGGREGWILWSPGPDGKYALTLRNIARAFDPNKPVPSPYLINHTYDPTNGSISPGDIWKVGP